MKRLLRSALVQSLVAWIAAWYMRLVYATSRWTFIGFEQMNALIAQGKPIIGCFWHGRMLLLPSFWSRRMPMRMLISDHQDGRLIARTIAHFGVETVTGSTSRGGAAALRNMIQALADGSCVAVTPDGPRGPRMRAASGMAMIAKLSGVPLFPVSYSTSRALMLSSWDRFLFALPFGHGVFVCGEPVHVARDADAAAIESARQQIEARLNQLTLEADRLCGRKPVEPAATPQRLATQA
ncbi:MAG TPA: lysophospholipid acyltransferase family protein [Alphaproteobacteria bacterium]|nr:lysophospholipid acyltransferase family protein [Alphaproteobacteria bacterium]